MRALALVTALVLTAGCSDRSRSGTTIAPSTASAPTTTAPGSSSSGTTTASSPTTAATPPATRNAKAMNLTDAELEVLARIVKGETWAGSIYEGQVAVAAVVLNRVRDSRWPNTVEGVAHQPNQFSCYNPSNRATLYEGPIRDEAMRAAKDAAAGLDPTGGATHYFNPFLVQPSWAAKLTFLKRIGTTARDAHDFYR